MNNVFERDESKLHKVPTKIISTMPIFIFAMIIAIIVSIVFFIKKDFIIGCIWLGVAVGCRLWGVFVDIYFNFQNHYTIDFKKDSVKITYELDNQIYSSKDCTATITIKSISKIKKVRQSVIVYGDITKKLPKQSVKSIRKYKICLKGFEDYVTIIDRLNDYNSTSV